MSTYDVKKPESREELIQLLRNGVKKEATDRRTQRARRHKPTVSGTASALGIHRDTLYSWLKEFDVDFKEVTEVAPTQLV